ncbi:Dephospho-CoA kinase [Cordyceps fumosorosea ARSEF 2679]|uniref:Dephospho-CoA kinase n=1 Tax=Cordyceps fumosorosea (strain ARSEF 2679) TaxID=1081104 RepID=A0A167RPS2_CORFA|nr:Dephospho-CoA kinase [Cordyceps fumosorosea ARSEF 2679]OAA58808.1 Dephospho-CoA kinase [Cordyceps fumosorosea ARSEF 2679]
MLLIGLTGSIATGKSTVSSLLSSPPHNIPIIDADLLARQVVEPGTPGYAAIVRHFAATTRRVFGETEALRRDRAALNAIVHPAVRRAMFRAVLACYLRGCWAVALDVPLLFEGGLDRFCGVTVVVAVRDPEVQLRRLAARDPHLSREDAENRVRSQGDVREKAARCEARGDGRGVVLWNDGSREELAASVHEALAKLKAQNPPWWSWTLLGVPPLAALVAAYRIWQNGRINRQWHESKRTSKL